jgi:hypothetical protein
MKAGGTYSYHWALKALRAFAPTILLSFLILSLYSSASKV